VYTYVLLLGSVGRILCINMTIKILRRILGGMLMLAILGECGNQRGYADWYSRNEEEGSDHFLGYKINGLGK